MTHPSNDATTAVMHRDGGERSTTPRENARIEEHSTSCFSIPFLPSISAACCGSCGDVIQPSTLLGTSCRCSRSTEQQVDAVKEDTQLRSSHCALPLTGERTLVDLRASDNGNELAGEVRRSFCHVINEFREMQEISAVSKEEPRAI